MCVYVCVLCLCVCTCMLACIWFRQLVSNWFGDLFFGGLVNGWMDWWMVCLLVLINNLFLLQFCIQQSNWFTIIDDNVATNNYYNGDHFIFASNSLRVSMLLLPFRASSTGQTCPMRSSFSPGEDHPEMLTLSSPTSGPTPRLKNPLTDTTFRRR